MDHEKALYLEKATLYERAERYDHMADEMRKFVAASDTELDKTERKLLSNAYKNVVGKTRSAWRTITLIRQKLEHDDPKRALVDKELSQIVTDLKVKCTELIALLDDFLIPNSKQPESKVFFLKMKGDHLRYLVEAEQNEDLKQKSKEAYLEATSISESELGPAHPFRLGLALNFSVYYYEIENSPETAYSMAKEAFYRAMPELDNQNEIELEDSATIMQLLWDNLTFWGGTDTDTQV